MDFLKENKTPIGVGILLLVAIYVYMTYFTKPTSATLTSSDNSITLSQNLLVTLQNLTTIKLDDTIFSDPAFQSLTDFGVIIPDEAHGRRNPFLPLTGSTQGVGAVNVALPKTVK